MNKKDVILGIEGENFLTSKEKKIADCLAKKQDQKIYELFPECFGWCDVPIKDKKLWKDLKAYLKNYIAKEKAKRK